MLRRGLLGLALTLASVVHASPAHAAAPKAVDVFAATPKSTSGNPQSALVILEGSDDDFDPLTYRILSVPSNGSLADPDNGGVSVSTGNIAGQRVTYTPDTNFTGTDSFTYRVRDGSANSTVQTAFVTVFDDYRGSARQIGADINGEAAGDLSGESVALSSDGQIVAIGAPSNNDGGATSGHVRIYRWSGSDWTQQGSDINGEAAGDQSGGSVTLSSDGQTVAIGARGNDGSGTASGHVRIYRWSGSDWTQQGSDINGEAAGDVSGESVALSSDGQIVAIGAPSNNDGGGNSGHVRVYRWSGGDWTQQGADIDGDTNLDNSGQSVALSGDGQTLAIGAPYADDAERLPGRARIYSWTGSAWQQLGSNIEGEAGDDLSGISLDLSSDGQTVAIGASRNDDGGADAGHTRIFRWDGSAWVQLGIDIDGESASNRSGTAVALSSDGQTVAIGANTNASTGFGSNEGHVRVFRLSYINEPPTAMDVYAATPRSTSGDPQSALVVLEGSDVDDDPLSYRIVSVPADGSLADPDNGNAPVSTGTIAGRRVTFTPDNNFTGTATFRYRVNDGSANSAIQTASITVFDAYRDDAALVASPINGEAAGDLSGYSIELSSDGSVLAIGARENDGAGSNSGQVRVYTRSGNTWMQRGGDINGEMAGEETGRSLALSGDGSILAVGAPISDDGGTEAGQVRVYRWTGSVWEQRGPSISGEGGFNRAADLNSLALSSDGNTLAIGAGSNDNQAPDAGHVRVYRWTGEGWSLLGAELFGEDRDDRFGTSVALSTEGGVLAVGIRDKDSSAADAGQVQVFAFTGAIWEPRGAALDGEAAADGFGQSVALSGDGEVLAAGSQLNDDAGTDAGHVRVYAWDGSNYVRRGADIDGEATDNRSGLAIDLSSDGLILAIGARRNDDGGNSAGHTRVYRWNGGSWIRIGSDIDGEFAGDNAGWAVSLSADGRFLASSDVQNDDAGTNAGRVRVFSVSNVPPQIVDAPPTSVGDVRNFSFQMQGEDLDPADELSWSLSHNPGWLSIDPESGRLSGTPGNDDVGTSTGIVITLQDDAFTQDTVTFSITVPDSDGDGLIDGRDDCDGTPGNETGVINGDGCGPSERDTDGDGANDNVDAFPDDPSEQLDSDGDGFGDNQELDAGSDPNDAGDLPIAPGLPVWLLIDSDNRS